MRSVTAPLTELSAADAVMLEIPPTADRNYEHNVLDFVNKIIPQCANVTIVQASVVADLDKSSGLHGAYVRLDA